MSSFLVSNGFYRDGGLTEGQFVIVTKGNNHRPEVLTEVLKMIPKEMVAKGRVERDRIECGELVILFIPDIAHYRFKGLEIDGYAIQRGCKDLHDLAKYLDTRIRGKNTV